MLVASGALPLSRLSLERAAPIFITRTIETGGSKWMPAPAHGFTLEKNRTNLETHASQFQFSPSPPSSLPPPHP